MGQSKKPLYEQVADYIRGNIESNEWKPGYQLPTELELAEKFNVSRITTKRAMEELAREGLIYRKKGQGSFVSNNLTSIKKMKKNKVISFIIPYESNREELLEYIKGASDYLITQGYFLSVCCVDDENDKQQAEYLKKLPYQGVMGIIYYPLNINTDYEFLIPMSVKKYPIVFIDKYFDSLPISSVVSDNFNGTYEILKKLISEGHKKIGFLSTRPIEDASSLKERYYAYCKALSEKNIVVDHKLILNGYYKYKAKCSKSGKYISYLAKSIKQQLDEGITGIITENDKDLVLAIGQLIQAGVKFPENFTILSYDNIKIPDYFNIKTISISQNFYTIGSKAAELVIDIINKNEYVNRKIVLPVDIIKS